MGAKKILGENNIAFMTGDPHKELRKRILPLFTPRALSIFLRVQGTYISTLNTKFANSEHLISVQFRHKNQVLD